MNALANLFTSLSLFSGFASVIFSLEGRFTFASWAIICAVVFDGLDGQIARLSRLPNEFGKQFDSLVDAIVFGISPSILGYTFLYNNFHLMAALTFFIYLVASVVRLARYNVIPREKMSTCFYGLPTTVSGGMLASFILLYRKYAFSYAPAIFLILVLALAFLMVSGVRYLNLYGLRLVLKKTGLAVLLAFLIAGIFFPQMVLFCILASYVIFSPFAAAKGEAK